MITKGITYKSGYKYQLMIARYKVMLPIPPGGEIFDYNRNSKVVLHDVGPRKGDRSHVKVGPFLSLYPFGRIEIAKGYAWDGPSGPAFDTDNFMTPSMVHDAIYQLMRNQVLPLDPYREIADEMMFEMCKDRGMCGVRAWWCKRGVRRFGKAAASIKRIIHKAP